MQRTGWSWTVTLGFVAFGFVGLGVFLLGVEGLALSDSTGQNEITSALRRAFVERPVLFLLITNFLSLFLGLVVGIVIGHVFHDWGSNAGALFNKGIGMRATIEDHEAPIEEQLGSSREGP